MNYNVFLLKGEEKYGRKSGYNNQVYRFFTPISKPHGGAWSGKIWGEIYKRK